MARYDHDTPSRRSVLRSAAAAAAGAVLLPSMVHAQAVGGAKPGGAKAGDRPQAAAAGKRAGGDGKPPFKISLAEWSLNKSLFGGKMTNLDFPAMAKNEFGIEAIEYVNAFFKEEVKSEDYLKDLKKRCDDAGVKSLLIMCDGEGALGDADDTKRKQAVENHYKWADAAKFLGGHSIRVNAQSSGTPEEQTRLAADGLRKLTEYCAKLDLNCIVENHGGLSSNGAWLAGVMKKVDHPRCGTLPDFGNFNLGDGKQYDRYQGVRELMPFAKAVSAKSHDFNEAGDEIHTDYQKMLRIVVAAGYSGYVGIEYEGAKASEADGIRATKKLLERVRDAIAAERAKG